jgi:hypothetical protein
MGSKLKGIVIKLPEACLIRTAAMFALFALLGLLCAGVLWTILSAHVLEANGPENAAHGIAIGIFWFSFVFACVTFFAMLCLFARPKPKTNV